MLAILISANRTSRKVAVAIMRYMLAILRFAMGTNRKIAVAIMCVALLISCPAMIASYV